jgi:hypothetical protein
MRHEMRWTAKKISQRLELIEPLVYRQRSPLPPFRLQTLDDPLDEPSVGLDIDDSGWQVVQPNTHWANLLTNFVLRTSFTVPADWEAGADVALYLPLGDLGGFSHPEALAYVDGRPYATCDRHHQEFRLRRWMSRLRHRPCPHRRRLAVDAGPDPPQSRPHLPHRAAADGAVPRLSLHPEPAAALRLRPPGLPALFEAIKERDRRRPLGAIGGMWVEADCNLSGAESLARQFLLGRSFFREHFGPRPSRRCCGCRMSSAMPGRCRSSSNRPGWNISSPSRSAGASTTACPTTPSGGRAGRHARADPFQHAQRERQAYASTYNAVADPKRRWALDQLPAEGPAARTC